MAWIFVIVAGLLLGALLIGSHVARAALIAVAVLLGAGAIWMIYAEHVRERDARILITPQQVELRAPSVERRGGLYYLVTAAKNLSEAHSIAALKIRVQALDCPSETVTDACEIVGDQIVSLTLNVPPQQVRGIQELAPFANLPQVRFMLWSFEVAEVRAEVR